MRPILFRINEIEVNSFWFSRFFAFILINIIIIFSAGLKEINRYTKFTICCILFIAAVLFGKLSYIILNGQNLSLREFSLKGIQNIGVSSQGSIIGCIIVGFILANIYKFNFYKVADFLIPYAGALVYAIGRLGCYFAGCCRGIETNVLWSVVFPHTQISVHPVQLYDSYLNFLLFLFLIEYRDKKRFEGELFLLFLVGNSIIRFFVEYFRWGVSAKVVAGFITQAQIASIVIILGSLVFWKILKEKQTFEQLSI